MLRGLINEQGNTWALPLAVHYLEKETDTLSSLTWPAKHSNSRQCKQETAGMPWKFLEPLDNKERPTYGSVPSHHLNSLAILSAPLLHPLSSSFQSTAGTYQGETNGPQSSIEHMEPVDLGKKEMGWH